MGLLAGCRNASAYLLFQVCEVCGIFFGCVLIAPGAAFICKLTRFVHHPLLLLLLQAIHQTVQKTLKQLRTDCGLIESTIHQRLEQDAINRDINHSKTVNGALLIAGTLLVLVLLLLAVAARLAGALCSPAQGGSARMGLCATGLLQSLHAWDETLEGAFTAVVGGLLVALFVFGGGAGFAWRGVPVMDKRHHKRLEEYRAAVQRAKQEADIMWEEYFACLAEAGDR